MGLRRWRPGLRRSSRRRVRLPLIVTCLWGMCPFFFFVGIVVSVVLRLRFWAKSQCRHQSTQGKYVANMRVSFSPFALFFPINESNEESLRRTWQATTTLTASAKTHSQPAPSKRPQRLKRKENSPVKSSPSRQRSSTPTANPSPSPSLTMMASEMGSRRSLFQSSSRRLEDSRLRGVRPRFRMAPQRCS